MVEDRCLGRSSRTRVVMDGDGVEELSKRAAVECVGTRLDQPDPELDVTEEAALVRGPEDRCTAELERPAGVVQERRRQQEIGAQAWMHLRCVPADGRDGDGVLEEPARVVVVDLRARRQLAEPCAEGLVAQEPPDERPQTGMGDLRTEKFEEPVELVAVSPEPGRESRGVLLGGLERAHLELEAVAVLVDPPENAHRVAFAEPAVEQLDVAPHTGFDSSARIDELQREVVGPRSGAAAFLLRDRVHPFHHSVLLELRDRAHRAESRAENGWYARAEMAVVKPFRAVRYDEAVAGPLESLVAPPYDVIDEAQRRELMERSPLNVVHLTLPDDENDAARLWQEWCSDGVLVRETDSTVWALEQDYIGPDGVPRTRRGVVASLRPEPYENRVVLPHERTHAGPKEGRLRLLQATGVHFEPIFLLYDGEPPFRHPAGPPDIEAEGAKLWRLPPNGVERAFADKRLLIADGHHRYETALAYGARSIPVVLVSTQDPGLMIFPTHRIVERINGPAPAHTDLPSALAALETQPYERAAAVLYRREGGTALVHGREGELDVQLVESLAPEGVTYTPSVDDAVSAVDSGRAAGAFIVRPTRIEDVFRFAEAGEPLPQKTTYFYPKLLSGLLFHPEEE